MIKESCVEAAGLTDLMRDWGVAHPYSTLDIFLAWTYTAHDLEQRRPGVCFTLNSAFAAHLRDLGMPCSIHLAGVQDHDSPDRADVGSHVTVVTELDGVPHLTDVGLGCGPLRPIPLMEGVHDFNGFGFRLTPVERGGQRWWRLDIPSAISRAFVAMEFCEEPDPAAALARAGHFLSPSTSPLRDVLLLQGWVGEKLVTVHGSTVSVRSSEGVLSRQSYEDVDAWRATIHAWFPGTFDDADLGQAWRRVRELSR